jgi:hypothetical protein
VSETIHKQHRNVFMVLSPRSLAYARCALESLFANSAEALHLHLITDSIADRNALSETMNALPEARQHRWNVTGEDELNDAEASIFAGLPHLRDFRRGHPCWRKVTDPLLLSVPGKEMILLDPDLYFPNRFRFEPTPAKGLVLMWQQPNCLLPPDVVHAAFDAGIALARHVDIGVSHWRAGSDLEWVNWMIGRLGGSSLPRMMHIEAIVWAAIAMREGGGYLDPQHWVCWRRTQITRARLKLGAEGSTILASEPWSQMKCFHAGGEAKWWLPGFIANNSIRHAKSVAGDSAISPFIELTHGRYKYEQQAKGLLRGLGYYRLFGARA